VPQTPGEKFRDEIEQLEKKEDKTLKKKLSINTEEKITISE